MVGCVDDLDQDIRGHAQDYLTGDSTLDAFEAWFVSETWDERTPLSIAVDLLLAERPGLEIDVFDDGLWRLISTIEVGALPRVTTGANAETVERASVAARSSTIRRNLAFSGS